MSLSPATENIRYRHEIKNDIHYYILFNEEETPVKTEIKIPLEGDRFWLDEYSGEAVVARLDESIDFEPHELKILMVQE